MNLKNKAIISVRWTSSRSLITVITSIIQVAVLARILDPKEFGLMSIVLIIVAVSSIFIQTGFSDALIAKEKPTSSQQATLYWLNVIIGIFIAALLYSSAPLVASIFNENELVEIIQSMSLVVLLSSMSSQYEALMKKELYFKQISLVYILSSIIGTLISIILAMNNYGIWSLVYSAIIVQLIISLQLFFYAFRYKWLYKFYINLTEVGNFLHFGYFRIGAALINQINSRADQLIIGILLGPTILGYYSVAYQIIMQPMSKINPILTHVSFPVFVHAKDDNQKLIKGYRKGIRILTAINAPLLLGMAAIAPVLVPLVLGNGWEKSIILIQIMSIYALLKSIGNVNIGIILAKGKYRWPFFWNLIILITVPVILFSVAHLTESIVSMSIALVVLEIFLFIFNYFLFIRTLLGKIFEDIISDLIGPLFNATIMAIFVHFYVNNSIVQAQWFIVISGIFLGAILYIFNSYFLQRKLFLEILEIVNFKINSKI